MPRHVGHLRQYSQQELIEVVTVAAIRRSGFSLQTIRKHLRKIQRELTQYGETLSQGGDVLFLINPKAVVFLNESDIKNHMINSTEQWAMISLQKELNQGRKTKAA